MLASNLFHIFRSQYLKTGSFLLVRISRAGIFVDFFLGLLATLSEAGKDGTDCAPSSGKLPGRVLIV